MKVVGVWSSKDEALPVTPILDPFVSLAYRERNRFYSPRIKKVGINILNV